jgi:hypothetical protein
MSIIDSLKRLERIGDENSKTTQKLIQAADELASTIAKQFAVQGTEHFELPTRFRKTGSNFEETGFLPYAIDQGCLVFGTGYACEGYVARDRENALAFSRDIANGLLGLLAEILAERLKDTTDGLAAIQTANQKIQ